jgi:hypothetical protein
MGYEELGNSSLISGLGSSLICSLAKNSSILWCKSSREYYLHAPVFKPDIIDVKWHEPQYDKIYEYLIIEKGFKESTIKNKINELKLMYEYYTVNNNNLITTDFQNGRAVPVVMTNKPTYTNNFDINLLSGTRQVVLVG